MLISSNLSTSVPTPRLSGAIRKSDLFVPNNLDTLPLLPRLTVKLGNKMATMGGGGGAVCGFLAGLPLFSFTGTVGPLVCAIGGYLIFQEAAKKARVLADGPGSAAWAGVENTRRTRPDGFTPCAAASHAVLAGTMVAGLVLGKAIFGPTAGAFVGAMGLSLVSGLVAGFASSRGERFLIAERQRAAAVP